LFRDRGYQQLTQPEPQGVLSKDKSSLCVVSDRVRTHARAPTLVFFRRTRGGQLRDLPGEAGFCH
ncbi:MAG: hypothetical protein ACRYF8_13095, partial [Janthinobacterium lividum]